MTQPPDQVLAQLLDECNGWLDLGSSVGECLSRYPEHARELAPLLEMITGVRTLRVPPQRDPALADRTRLAFVAEANSLAQEKTRTGPWAALVLAWGRFISGFASPSPFRGAVAAVITVVMMVGLLTTGAVTVSARSLPGDALYVVKTTAEQVRVLLARDQDIREALIETINATRRMEAREILHQGRSVRNMPLVGVIEAMKNGRWQISDLQVLITEDTRIEGAPFVGAHVQGLMYAPGDHTLVASFVEVLSSPDSRALATATPTPTEPATATRLPTATRRRATATRWFSQPIRPLAIPTDLPTASKTPTATDTATPTGTPTGTPTATPTVTVTPTPLMTVFLPPTRTEPTKQTVVGWVKSINGSRWTVEGTSFDTDGNTKYIGSPGVGDRVTAVLIQRGDGTLVALEIHKTGSPEATPVPVEFTKRVQSINGDRWNIGGSVVIVSGSTVFEGNPGVGDLVSFKGEKRSNGEIWAFRIKLIPRNEVGFEGAIESMNGDTWRVGGTSVRITGETSISGRAEIGAWAEVLAYQEGNEPLTALKIRIEPPTATPVPPPTATNTPVVTQTFTPEPSPTQTKAPPATDTPTPKPTASFTPEPSPTLTKAPPATDTATPEPTATDAGAPTATVAPPTSTATSPIAATNTPAPTATEAPAPTATTESGAPQPTDTPAPIPTLPPAASATLISE